MEYRVVPFVASLDANRATSDVAAEQLTKVISQHSVHGWNYVRLESVTTFVAPDSGCFGIGGKPGYTTSMQLIVFERDK